MSHQRSLAIGLTILLPQFVSAQRADTASVSVVAPGRISGHSVFRGTFTPDGDTMYYFRKTGAGEDYRIFRTYRMAGDWIVPEQVSFGGNYSDLYPTVSTDGQCLVFVSYRPVPGRVRSQSETSLWMVRRTGGSWGSPVFLAEASVPQRYHSQPALQRDGSLQFAVQSTDYRGKAMLVAQPKGDSFGPPDTLPVWKFFVRTVPETHHLYDVTPSPDGSHAILALGAKISTSAAPSASDLWISWRSGDSWSAAIPLEGGVNSTAFENFPFWSPNGNELFLVRDFETMLRLSLPARRGR